MLALCDGWMVPCCLALLVPVYVMSAICARKTFLLNSRLNDELEREVEVISHAQPQQVHGHYQKVARCRVKLANFQAINFALMNVCVFGLIAAALLRCCVVRSVDAGQVFAVVGYVTMFAMGLGNTPALVQQLARLRDIKRRVQAGVASIER